MRRSCSVCSHPDSLSVNEALVVEGRSLRDIGRQYGLDKSALQRHKAHIPHLLLQASRHTESFEADSILLRIEDLERRTLKRLEILEEEDDADHRTILQAIREQRANIELIARVRQIIDSAPKIVTVHISDEAYRAIAGALEQFPEAQFAVVDALAPLAELEG